MAKKQKYNTDLTTRRRWPRLTPDCFPSFKGIILNHENQAHVIDISQGGALIETGLRLCPKAKVGVKVLMAEEVFRITGSVLRSSLTALKSTPIYKSAISFSNPLTVLDCLAHAKAEGFASVAGGK